MSEKYIDLAAQVTGGADRSNTVSFRMGVAHALEWLDAHPDQVPGRTITASEFIRAANGVWGDEGSGPNRSNGYAFGLAHRLGITVIPDPEPTNAEKLEMALTDYALQHGGMRGGVDEIAAHLDEAGVKAPGGDDDH